MNVCDIQGEGRSYPRKVFYLYIATFPVKVDTVHLWWLHDDKYKANHKYITTIHIIHITSRLPWLIKMISQVLLYRLTCENYPLPMPSSSSHSQRWFQRKKRIPSTPSCSAGGIFSLKIFPFWLIYSAYFLVLFCFCLYVRLSLLIVHLILIHCCYLTARKLLLSITRIQTI